jgi:hypothetical protein
VRIEKFIPARKVLNPARARPRLPKRDMGVAAAYRYPFVSAELTCSSHCSVPRSGSSAEISWIPLVSVPENVVTGMEHELGHRVEDMAIRVVGRDKVES